MQPTKIIDVKIEKVELHQTENAWRPTKFSDTIANAKANGDGQVINLRPPHFGQLSIFLFFLESPGNCDAYSNYYIF